MATTLSLRRLWTIYKRTALTRAMSKREMANIQLAFYSGARGVLKVFAYLIEDGDYEELLCFGAIANLGQELNL
jgi:hypothetical protein